MSDETPGAPTAVPPEQPVVGDGTPATNQPLEIPEDVLRRIREVTVPRQYVQAIAAKDKCTQRILQRIRDTEAMALPTQADIAAQKKIAAMAYQELSRLQSVKQNQAATLEMLRAQLRQRLTTIQEAEEARRVRVIRGHLSPKYLDRADAVVPSKL